MKKLLVALAGIGFVLVLAWCAFAWDYVRRSERDANLALALALRCEADHPMQAADGRAPSYSNCADYLEEDRRKESARIMAAATTGAGAGVVVGLLLLGGRRLMRTGRGGGSAGRTRDDAQAALRVE